MHETGQFFILLMLKAYFYLCTFPQHIPPATNLSEVCEKINTYMPYSSGIHAIYIPWATKRRMMLKTSLN